jgi:hypothetical protein
MKFLSLLLTLIVSLTSLGQTQWSVVASQGIQQMDIDANDNIYVLNYNRIYRIDALPTNGTRLVTQVATISGWATQWDGPTGLTIDKVNNKLYVLHGNYNTNTGNARILVADISNAPATITFSTFYNLGAYVYSGRLAYNNGYVYYVHAHGNQDINRIQVSNPTSASTVFNCSGWGDHNLESSSLTFDQNGSLYFGETSARDKVYKINNPNVAVTPATLSAWDNLITSQNSNLELIADYVTSAQYNSHYPFFNNGTVFISKSGSQIDKYNVSTTSLSTQNANTSDVYVVTSDGTLYYASGTTIFKSTATNLNASIVVTPSSLSGFSTCAGTASSEQTTSVSATGLGSNLILTAPSGYEISLTAGSGFSTSITLTPTSGTVTATTVYVRLNSTATGGTFNGNLAAVSGTTFSNIALSGIKNLNTALAASSTPSICPNATITNITITTTGATGIGTPTGLPTGVSANFSGNTITISGQVASNATPQVYNYTIPLQGGCGTVNATGSITVFGNAVVSSTNLPNFNSASIGGAAVPALTYTCTNVTSYQWFSNTTNSNTGGIAISGATSSTYTPPSTIAELGTKYYYCEATGCSSTIVSSVATVHVFRNYYSKASATDFNDLASWGINTDGTGTAPAAIDNTGAFDIRNNSQMTLSANATVRALTINTGKLTVANNTLTISILNQNNTELNVTNGGTLEVTGGSIVLNGAAYFANGSGLTQSGGLIVLYPSSGAGATSIGGVSLANIAFGIGYTTASAASVINSTLNAQKFNCTGGTIQIVDPAASSNAAVASFAYQASTGNVTFGPNHNFKLGNGVSTLAGGSINGFMINSRVNTGGYLSFGNFEVDALTGTNRHVINAGSTIMVTENLTVTSGTFRQNVPTYVSGNLTNHGTYSTNDGLLIFAQFINGAVSPSTVAQTIGGNGTYQNHVTTPTSNLNSFTVNNTNATGVTLNVPLSISGTLTITAGKINTTATNLLTLGTATAAGTLSYVAGQISGPFARTFATSSSTTALYDATTLFPVGDGTNYIPIHIDPVNGAGPVVMRGQAFNTNSGTAGSGISAQLSNDRWEALVTSGSSNLTSCFVGLNDAQIATGNVIAQSATAAGTYNLISLTSTFVSGTPNALRTPTAITAVSYTGYFTYAAPGSFTWTGGTSTDWNNASNWSPQFIPSTAYDIIIPATGITNFPTVTSLTIGSGKTITLNSNAQLTISGTLTNNGTLTIESGATLVQGATSTLAGSGTYNVRQSITGANNGSAPNGRFWYLGSPVSLASSAVYFGNTANVLKKRNEAGNAWTDITNAAPENLVIGRGYYTQAMANTTINFTGGVINNGNVTIGGLTRTAGQGFEGFNLVSNPYPSYLNWDLVTKTNVGNTMWYRTNDGINMVFDTYVANAAGGVGTNLGGTSVTKFIPPMQSFWVRVNPNANPSLNNTGSLGLTNAMRAHFTSLGGSTAGLKSTNDEPSLFLRMNLLQASNKDQLIVYVNETATNGFDNLDGEKMMQATLPQFYTKAGDKKIVINGLNSAKKQQSLPITMELPTTGVHSFIIEDLEISNGLVWLEDKQEEIIQALEPGTVYEFYAASGMNSERFVLHFQLIDDAVPTNVYNEVNSSANFSGKGANVHAEAAGVVVIKLPASAEGVTDIQIRDAAGKIVYTGFTNTLETSVQLAQANGIYYVTLNSTSGVEVRKVFIQQ